MNEHQRFEEGTMSHRILRSPEQEPPIRVLRMPEVLSMTGICKSSIYQQIANGAFPKQLNLGPRSVGWNSKEIEEWIQKKIDAREQG